MPSSSSDGIAVTLRAESEQDHFRLVELPTEVLTLLTSGKPPILQLKSKEDRSGSAKDANVVLCTPDKTYNLRQVSTSNSVFITRATATGVEAIAKCDSSMEVLSVPRQSAEPFIRAVLPVYTSTGNFTARESVSREALFSHIPLSQDECEEGWAKAACFESIDPPGCYIPSAQVQTRIWDGVNTSATALGIDLTVPVSKDSMLRILDDLRGEGPPELLSEILVSVSDRGADESFVVGAEKFVCATGRARLQASCDDGSIPTSTFLAAWADSVPEKWRQFCLLSALNGSHTTSDGGKTVAYLDQASTIPGANGIGAPNAKVSLGAKRKWHDKFRATKKN